MEPREVFKSSILSNAASIILLHNHPSGELQPSEGDVEVTKRIGAAGKMLGIPLLDHIILGQGEYMSLREAGYIGTEWEEKQENFQNTKKERKERGR